MISRLCGTFKKWTNKTKTTNSGTGSRTAGTTEEAGGMRGRPGRTPGSGAGGSGARGRELCCAPETHSARNRRYRG